MQMEGEAVTLIVNSGAGERKLTRDPRAPDYRQSTS